MLTEYKLFFDDELGEFVATNVETGEIRKFTAAKKTTSSRTTKKKEDENPNPQITLEENKYKLNSAAVTLMGVEPEDKLTIKMRKINGTMVPVIGTNTAFKIKDGNRLTKSFTVACRGANHDALSAYGTLFDIEVNNDLPGTFIMRGDNGPVIVNDENIADVELPEDLNVDFSEVSEDSDIEIDGSVFENLLGDI